MNQNCKSLLAKIVVFCMVFMLVQWYVPTKEVQAAESYYWPTPTATTMSRGYSSSHTAVDISAPIGTNIYSTKSGTVKRVVTNCTHVEVGSMSECVHNGVSGAGISIDVLHDDGTWAQYAHMLKGSIPSNIIVGARVNQGDFIGQTGSSGYSTGPHLHFGIRNGANAKSYFTGTTLVNNNPSVISYVYNYSGSSTPTTPTIVYNSSKFTSLTTEYFTETTAKIATTYAYESFDDAGFYFGTSNNISSMTKVSESKYSSFPQSSSSNSYRLGESYDGYGYKWWNPLTPGTTYYWAFYLKQGNTEYISTVQSFTTKGGGDKIAPKWENGKETSSETSHSVSAYYTDNVAVDYVRMEVYPEDYENLKKIIDDTTATEGYYSISYDISQFSNITGYYVYKYYAVDTSGNKSAVISGKMYLGGFPLKEIVLDYVSLYLEMGLSETISVTYIPSKTTDDKTVTWTSSNTSVATVDSNGKVTGVSPGTATITAKVGSYTATCELTIMGITLDKSELQFTNGGGSSFTLQASYKPHPQATSENKKVTWASSNPSVATVDSNGKVTTVAPGTATITAKVGDFTATCKVTVNLELWAINLNKHDVSLKVGEDTNLSVIYVPSNTTDNKTVTWTSSNPSVATVNSSGKVTAVAPGTSTITAKVGNHTATCLVTVTSGSTTTKLSAPQNPIFYQGAWFTFNYGAVANSSGYAIELYKDGTKVWSVSNTSVIGYPCAEILENYGAGNYVFKVRANGSGSYSNSDWATSGTFTYTVPNKKYGVVSGVKWKDGVLSWNPVPNAGKYTTYGVTLCDASTNKGIVTTTTFNCKIDYSNRMEVGKTYYARIYTISQDINTIASSEGYVKSDNYTYGAVETPLEKFVSRMYTIALNRNVDPTGHADWVGGLTSGKYDGATVGRGIFLSPEFTGFGLSNDEFLNRLYLTFFDRNPDSAGKQNWMNHLNAGYSREYVLAEFINSEEFTNLCNGFGVERGVMLNDGNAVNVGVPKFVNRLYSTVMGRTSDWQGYTNWVKALATKSQNAEQVAKSFFASQEYLNKNTNNTTFLTDLYRTFFDREPDSAGMTNWKNQLNAGMTRNTVIAEFAKSAEFKAIAASYGLQYENVEKVSLFEQNVLFGSIEKWAPICTNVTDIEGNTYENVRMLYHTKNYTSISPYKIVFSLNNEYTKLCGKITLPKGELDKNYEASNWLEFRDDNNNVIAVSPSCNKNATTVEFSIDVTGVKNLTIIGKRDSFLESGNTYLVGDLELYR